MTDFLNTDDSERKTILLALEGDHEAGRDALLMCCTQLMKRSLSPALADYLAVRLLDVLESTKPDRIITSDDFRQALLNALRINKPPGKPADSLPKWQIPLGAFAALLVQRGYKPKKINAAMSDARQRLQSKDLNAREAQRIRKTYASMQKMNARTLVSWVGNCGEILKEYPPL